MLAEKHRNTLMRLRMKSVFNQQGGDSMKNRIIHAIGQSVPKLSIFKYRKLVNQSVGFFDFKLHHNLSFFIAEAHTSTILSCSTLW